MGIVTTNGGGASIKPETPATSSTAETPPSTGENTGAAPDVFAENFKLPNGSEEVSSDKAAADAIAAAYQEKLREAEARQKSFIPSTQLSQNRTENFSHIKEGKRSYQFPSAPSSYHFPWLKDKTIIPDGIYTTANEREIAELEAAVEAGNIFPYSLELSYSENPQMIPAPPVRKDALN